jgi:hypothetical protein
LSLQEAARVALRQRQLREQECARINAIKIHNQWRKIMRLGKADELRQQIEILSQNHEREVDRKDALIQVGGGGRGGVGEWVGRGGCGGRGRGTVNQLCGS